MLLWGMAGPGVGRAAAAWTCTAAVVPMEAGIPWAQEDDRNYRRSSPSSSHRGSLWRRRPTASVQLAKESGHSPHPLLSSSVLLTDLRSCVTVCELSPEEEIEEQS